MGEEVTVETTTTTTSTVVETAVADQSYTSGADGSFNTYHSYLYADDWSQSSLSAGDRVYQLTVGDGANTGHYFFGQDTYDRFCSNGEFDAEGLSNYLQVASYRSTDSALGEGAEDGIYTFKGEIYAYTVKEDTNAVAEAECKANFEWGDGGARQLYVEDLDNLERDEEYDCVATNSVELSNGDTVVVASDQDLESDAHAVNDYLGRDCYFNESEHPSETATEEAARISDGIRDSTAGRECCEDMYREESEDSAPEEKARVDDEAILAQNGEEDESVEMKETVPDDSVLQQNSEENKETSSIQDDTGGSGGGSDLEEEEGPSIE